MLILGAPASGKSRLAERLRERLAAHQPCLLCSKDDIKEALFDTLGAGDARWSRRLSDASFAVLFTFAARVLRPGSAPLLLLEGNFRPGEHEAPLHALLAGGGAQPAQILVQASRGTRAARLAARPTDPGRHPAHRDAERDARLDEEARAAQFLDLPGPRWHFDGDAAGEGPLAALYTQLQAWLSAAGTSGTPGAGQR